MLSVVCCAGLSGTTAQGGCKQHSWDKQTKSWHRSPPLRLNPPPPSPPSSTSARNHNDLDYSGAGKMLWKYIASQISCGNQHDTTHLTSYKTRWMGTEEEERHDANWAVWRCLSVSVGASLCTGMFLKKETGQSAFVLLCERMCEYVKGIEVILVSRVQEIVFKTKISLKNHISQIVGPDRDQQSRLNFDILGTW